MAKKTTVKKKTAASGKAADVLPAMPGKFVVIGMSTAQNKAIAEAIQRKLAGG